MEKHKRSFDTETKKIIAARQGWKCNTCECILPASYEIDHVVPLCEGGEDKESNAAALCPNCHAEKSMRERIRMRQRARNLQFSADDREDIRVGDFYECSLCHQRRPCKIAEHPVCPALHDPGFRSRALVGALSRFAYVSRVPTAKQK